MPRTFAGFMLPLLAALALAVLLPSAAVAGPPEGASGKMVLDGKKVPTPVGVLLIRQTREGMVVEGPGFQGRAARITWLKPQGQLYLEGNEEILAELTEGSPGEEGAKTLARRLRYSLPGRRFSLEGNLLRADR